jgi:hypothetical protein
MQNGHCSMHELYLKYMAFREETTLPSWSDCHYRDTSKTKLNSVACSPQANYTDREAAAC